MIKSKIFELIPYTGHTNKNCFSLIQFQELASSQAIWFDTSAF